MLTARIDRELLAAFDALAEGRGGRSALLRTVLQQSLRHVADAPRIAPCADSAGNRVSLRFTDAETAVLDHRAADRGIDRAGWIKALVRRHLALKANVDDGMRDAVAPIRMQLQRIGRNLNQAMKAGNAAMMADSGLQIDRELRRIADMREEINEQIVALGDALRGDAAYWRGCRLMPFGDREDELWEAMKPRFKPRTVSDPNIRYARHLVNGTGPFAASTSSPAPTANDARASRQPTEADLRQAREAMQIALGKAQQPPFVSKTRDRWTETKRKYEAAAQRLDRTGDRDDRRLARDVRQFIQERADIETVPDRMLRDAEKRVRDAQARTKPDQQPDRGVPRGTRPPPTRRR